MNNQSVITDGDINLEQLYREIEAQMPRRVPSGDIGIIIVELDDERPRRRSRG